MCIRDSIRGCFRRPGPFVSPWARIGRLCGRLVESESRVQDARRTSRPTGKSLFTRSCRTNLAFFQRASYDCCLGIGTAGGIRGRSGRPGTFVSSWERGGLALASAKWNRKAGFRNRAYSPGTRDVFPVQRLLPDVYKRQGSNTPDDFPGLDTAVRQ